MSSQNVETVRRAFEAFSGGDFDAAFALFHPEVEWRTADDEPDARTIRGHTELRRFVKHLADPWTDRFGPAVEFTDFIECGDWVLAPWRGRVHGHGSGIEIEISETYAALVRDGRIARVEEYRTVEQALNAKRPRLGDRGRFMREE